MEGAEKLILLIGMGAEQSSLALVQLDLSGLDGSGHTPLLCDHGGNFSVRVMVVLELSCDPPIFLSSGVVVHHHVHRVVGQAFKEPVGKFPFFVESDALGRERFMLIDGLVDPSSAQAVQPIQFDEWGKDVDGVRSISDGDEEVIDISFVLFVSLQSLHLPLPSIISLVHVLLPVFIGCFQTSHMHFAFCQIFPLLLEYFKLFLIVMANFLIFSCNSCQSLHNEKEFLPPG